MSEKVNISTSEPCTQSMKHHHNLFIAVIIANKATVFPTKSTTKSTCMVAFVFAFTGDETMVGKALIIYYFLLSFFVICIAMVWAS